MVAGAAVVAVYLISNACLIAYGAHLDTKKRENDKHE